MSLITCPECGKEMSDKAKKCPNCGYPIKLIQSNNLPEKTAFRRLIKFIVIAIVAIIIIASGSIYYFVKYIPSVMGLGLDDAISKLEKFKVEYIIEYEYTENIDKGVIAAQKKNENKNVNLIVSSGRLVEIPDLIGKECDEAIRIINEISSDITVSSIVGEVDEQVSKDGVIYVESSSDPLYSDGEIILHLSAGLKSNFANIKGMAEKDAINTIEQTGNKTKVEYVYSSTEKGKVISYYPESYIEDKESTVRLKVSLGKGRFIPNVIGNDITEAVSILERLGLKINYQYDYRDVQCSITQSDSGCVSAQNKFGEVDPNVEEVLLKVNLPSVTIRNLSFDSNSVGGINIDIRLKNESDKPIKYVIITMSFFNNIGEKVNCEVNRSSKMNLEYTGELKAGNSQNVYWDSVIYNSSVGAVLPETVTVEFMDGTKQVISNLVYWQGNDFYDGGLYNE